MSSSVEHIPGHSFHGRKGAISHQFRYGVDYVFTEIETLLSAPLPLLFSRDRWNIMALWTKDHGGKIAKGQGARWVRDVLKARGLTNFLEARIILMTQPRILGAGFNPVSFWMIFKENDLYLVIAEVNNTFGERHSYLCHNEDFSPIGAEDRIKAQKIFYVSPFQLVEGAYEFRFDIRPTKIGIWIDYRNGKEGLYANFIGRRRPLSSWSILALLLKRPLGFMRVSALIYLEALRLKVKGAQYIIRGRPPESDLS